MLGQMTDIHYLGGRGGRVSCACFRGCGQDHHPLRFSVEWRPRYLVCRGTKALAFENILDH